MPRDRTNYGDSDTLDQTIGTKISEGGPTENQERERLLNEGANREVEPTHADRPAK